MDDNMQLVFEGHREEMNRFGMLVLVLFLFIHDAQFISLNGQWTGYIESFNKTHHVQSNNMVIAFPAIVPGGIYTDLVKANLIPGNLIGANDIKNRWISNRSVTYVTYFTANETLLEVARIVLIFHGLDTFATIFLNDKTVGTTSNMFLKYNFDIKDYMKVGENQLKVVFASSVKIAKEFYNNQSISYIVPPKCVPREYNGECHVNHIRKMQASFAWDWGPAFPSIGIWKDVELVSVAKILVTDVTADVYRENSDWKITITVFLKALLDKQSETVTCNILAALDVDEETSISNSSHVPLKMHGKYTNVSIVLNIPGRFVKEWWPNGYGEQILYNLRIRVNTFNDVVDQSMRVGFRTVELVQKPLKKGYSFYFQVNGIPIFAKGSNWIPSSIFPELSAKEETVKHLLQSAKVAHMNMLRVWGGGVYESNLFYDLADEYGIMIWQDFMFACSMYPTTKSFLESVEEEVVQNVRRLKHHPSIVLWAGNNENEAALYDNWYGTGTAQIYKEDYIKLYVNVIRKNIEHLDTTRPFVVSSPSDGLYTDQNSFIGPDPSSKLYGDVHYYNYISNGWNINQYPRTRFASEYGFQSIPSIYTMATAAESTSDLQLHSKFMQHRQHLPNGYGYMMALVSMNFVIPRSNDTIRDLIDFIYLSQINQAVSVKIETEAYRQAKTDLNAVGEGMTMGALYWQLNDVWQAPSWSSIEFGGRWKMLHYYAVEFFAPVIVTPHVSASNELAIYIVSDKLSPIENCTLNVYIYKWQSIIPIYIENFTDITIESNAAKVITVIWLDNFLTQAGCGILASARKNCIAELVLKDKDGKQIAPYNYVYPSPLSDVNLPSANITVRIESTVPGKLLNYLDFNIEVTSNKIALFVWLDVGKMQGRFSENGFHIFHEKKNIILHMNEAITETEILGNMTVTTLSEIYKPARILNISHFVH